MVIPAASAEQVRSADRAPVPDAALTADQAWTEVEPGLKWSALSTAQKHERILCAAGRLFASDGLDVPMPAVAALAGAGVGSLYRQFPSKQELLAELVIRRLEQMRDAAAAACARTGDHWTALKEMLWTTVARQVAYDFLGEAWSHVESHERVQLAAAAAQSEIERLIELARGEGRLRADATGLDIRLLFVAARASRQVDQDAWRRVVTLLIDGLAAGCDESSGEA